MDAVSQHPLTELFKVPGRPDSANDLYVQQGDGRYFFPLAGFTVNLNYDRCSCGSVECRHNAIANILVVLDRMERDVLTSERWNVADQREIEGALDHQDYDLGIDALVSIEHMTDAFYCTRCHEWEISEWRECRRSR